MPLLENTCWDILKNINGKAVIFNKGQANTTRVENAMSQNDLERDLVLKYKKSSIEDSIYFLEKRGYLIKHGYLNLTLVAYQLSPLAFVALQNNQFSDEEQNAFKEAIFDAKTASWFGLKVNLGEAFRRLNKKRHKQ